jgi:hypothetical protein
MSSYGRRDQCAPAWSACWERNPAVYTVSEDRPRGTSTDQSSREFPVLFHLMDVSRPRTSKQATSIGSANLLSAVEHLGWPPADDIESFPAASASEPPAATTQSLASEGLSPASQLVGTPTETEDLTTTEPTAPVDSADQPVVAVEVPPPPPLVTLRKKPKTSATEDWFASHGKFIAVAFVLALIATIYFARVNREKGAVAKPELASQQPLVNGNPAPSKAENVLADATSVQTASVATPAASARSSPVELRAPQLVAEPSVDKPKDNLFEFAKNADDRIAARPDNASQIAAPALSPPAISAPTFVSPTTPEIIATPAPQLTSSTASTDTAAYPVTSSPPTHYPVSMPPAASYPATSYPTTPPPPSASAPVLAPPGTNGYQPQPQLAPPGSPPVDYRSQYPVTPASIPTQPPAAPAWNVGQPASYPSYDSTARGPRNERTGSGTY